MKKIALLLIFINLLFGTEATYKELIKNGNYEKSVSYLGKIKIETYLFKKDKHLSDKYMQKIKEYIRFYEKLIGKYPYKKFVLIESDSPVGYSMPSYTVIGSMIIDKEFVLNRSLAHEILHQWFGESVQVSQNSGNWSEGLVSYLSDYLLSEKKGKGISYRKNVLHEFPLFVTDKNDKAVKDFKRRRDRASMLIGYSKSSFIFHMIRKELGDETFFEKIREFYKKYAGEKASIKDLCSVFQTKLCGWFYKKGMAKIEAENMEVSFEKGKFSLSFDLKQKTKEIYPLYIDIKIVLSDGEISKRFFINRRKIHIETESESKPLKLIADPDLNLFRKLSQKEEFKTIANVVSSKKILIVTENKKAFKNMKKIFKKAKISRKPSQKEADKNDLLFLDDKLYLAKRVIQFPYLEKEEKIFTVKTNPFNKKFSVSFFNYDPQILRKLSRYMNFSSLIFKNSKITQKLTNESKNGIEYKISSKSICIKVPKSKSLKEIVKEMQEEGKRVIFVGENHPNFANHLNQLKIIKLLHKKREKLAIGMEMFQKRFQPVLDEYIKGEIDLKTFLKKTRYFKKWKFNFNLYRPIVEYARNNSLPLVALNIDDKITKKIAKSGIFSLSEKEMKKLPSTIDFDNLKYEENMKNLLSFQHIHNKKTKNINSDYMFEAQIVWDEIMAENAADFLKKHPDYTMVILAGNGHIKNFYGIPQRLYKRVPVPYSVIAQDILPTPKSADYAIFTSDDVKVKEPLKLGIYLKSENSLIAEKILKNSLAKRLGIKKGDKILKINKVPVKDLGDLKLELYFVKKGDEISVTVRRKNETITLKGEAN